MKLQALKLGMAFAVAGVSMYIGCLVLMLILGKEETIWFFNSILHGFDVTNSIRMNVPLAQTASGIIITAGISCFIGWLIAFVYNLSLNS